MEILTGTKREITIRQYKELLAKHIKRSTESMECFNSFSGIDDLERLKEDAENIIYYCNQAIEAINFMNNNNIE